MKPETDASLPALDHAANWVRFADTKATVLTAALGVVLTMLVANVPSVVRATSTSELAAVLLVSCAGACAILFVFTLTWLIIAIAPRRGSVASLNRFSWPSLVHADTETIRDHVATTPASADAWEQTLALSKVASQKFSACRNASIGFGAFVVVALTCVIVSHVINAL